MSVHADGGRAVGAQEAQAAVVGGTSATAAAVAPVALAHKLAASTRLLGL